MNGMALTNEERKFIDMVKDAPVVSLGIGSIITGSSPRLEIPGVMVIDYDNRERPTKIWKLAIEQKLEGKSEDEGDF